MTRALIALPLLLVAGWAQANTQNCTGVPQVMPLAPGMVSSVAPELQSSTTELGAPTGVLSQPFSTALSLDQVLLRMQIEACRVAVAVPAPSALDPNDPAAYRPRTEHDNAPWRFDMSQNGKRMTADEFDAWMKARGVRIATGRPTTMAPAATEGGQEAAPAPAECTNC